MNQPRHTLVALLISASAIALNAGAARADTGDIPATSGEGPISTAPRSYASLALAHGDAFTPTIAPRAFSVGLAAVDASGAAAEPVAEPQDYCGDEARPCGPLADDAVVEVRRVAPNLERDAPPADDGFRVSVDGEPVTDSSRKRADFVEKYVAPKADAQRKADLALDAHDVRVQVSAPDATPVLSVVPAKPVVGAGETAVFFPFINYAAWVDRAELRVFEADDLIEGAPSTTASVQLGQPIRWTPPVGSARSVRYVLRVYDKDGRFDETEPQTLRLLDRPSTDASALKGLVDGKGGDRQGPLFENQRRIANIPVKGPQVTVSGAAAPGATVEGLGEVAPLDRQGQFVLQQILPPGMDEVVLRVAEPGKPAEEIRRKVDIPRSDRFFVGIVDLTAGHRLKRGGDSEMLADDADSRRDFVDGRLAFYYKGQVTDGWRVTASADTGEQRLADLFDQFDEKDPRALLRRLDPDRHYPVYGDDSITVEDAPTSGRFYVRAESDTTRLMWGNFHTDIGDTELLRYQRGLYGGQAEWRGLATTAQGERRTEANLFAADPGTIGSREDFASTGGSAYYLRHQDVSQGSERLFVEVRDRDSGLVLQRTELVPFRDYEVNYIQGRVLLRQALPMTADADEFVNVGGLGGNPVWLVATYEYVPGFARPDAMTAGGRVQHWLTDSVRLGASAFRQGEGEGRQELQGADLMLRYRPGTFLRAEVARSDGAAGENLVSSYGGYDFTHLQTRADEAMAYLLEGESDLSDLSSSLQGRVRAYYRNREAGFSAPGELTFGESLEQYGGKLDVTVAEGLTVSAKADITHGGFTERSAVEAGIRRETAQGWFGSVGVRADDQKGQATPQSPIHAVGNAIGGRTDAAVQLGYRHSQKADVPSKDRDRPWAAYVFGQKTLDRDGGRLENDRFGVGGEAQISDRLTLKGAVSEGDLGFGADLRTDLVLDNRGSLYLSYALAGENPDALYNGRQGRLGAGARYRVTDRVSVFGEERYEHGDGPTGLTQSYGVDFNPIQSWTFGLKFETGELKSALGGGIDREVVAGSVDYGDERLRWSSSLEHRREQADGQAERRSWLTRNSVSWKVDPSLRVYAKGNVSISEADDPTQVLDADFYELALAGAYRPVNNDRLNLLAKVTYLHDLPSPAQVDALGLNLDFAQRSTIVAVDGTYQVTPRLDVGAKVAYRLGELRPSRDSSAPWFDSQALFLALRADYRVVKEWDVVVEARRLSVKEADEVRTGGLVAVYRHLGDHVKIGAGFNFTDFSDDLSDLSYDDRGFFLNVIGKF
jgi:hypothetical protein